MDATPGSRSGIASTPGNGVAVYAEIARAGTPPKLVLVQEGVEVGQPYELAVLEMAGRPGWWRVWVDGGPVTAPIRMSGSSGRWAPMATAESWNAGTTTCNAFGFRFEDVSVSYGAGGSWRAFVPGHRFLDDGTTLGEVTPSIVHSRAYARALATTRSPTRSSRAPPRGFGPSPQRARTSPAAVP